VTSVKAIKIQPELSRAQAVERAQALAEDLRQYVDEAERIRRLPTAAVDAMLASGLTPLVRSAHFGGYGLDWITHVDCVSEVAKVSASMGWCFSFLIQHQFVLGLFPAEAQEYVYDLHPNPKIVTSFMPAGKAEPADGGFRLSGRWTFGSGGDHCDWAIVGGTAEPNTGPRWFLLKPGQFKIVDTWHSVGLKGTGSNDIVIEDAFVSDDFMVEMGPVYTGQSPGSKFLKEPIYRASLGSQFQFALLAPMLGVARGALESFVEFSRDRMTGMVPTKVSENPLMLARIGESSGEIEAAYAILDKVSRGIWSGELAAPTASPQVGRDFATAAKLLVQATDRLFAVVGARGLNEGNAVGRHWRDIHAVASHAALQTDGMFQNYGRSTFADPASPPEFTK
jgi:3-hydroxy-9,10-secoandrosta-1,3,5(10)-triene-9,17-dione monooxygenase